MPTTHIRAAARVVVLDQDDRILLLRYDEGNGVFWATPGGALEPGETHVQAAVRELHEELGVEAVEIGFEIATRAKEHVINGELTRQVERYFVARVPAGEVNPSRATQTDDILAWQWWSLSELGATHQTVYPLGLTGLVQRFLMDGPPSHPAVLEG
ncbi:NUDIX hydrolase [Microtetraspora niveoalba]|uniref:NUDIX hydrolase n=1 Tax=Microtetraspora niveoalba TaxID=46175 RepID=UPI0008332C8E|nr:NUDIX domain-containing protein [Microtetraspora niveoalba]